MLENLRILLRIPKNPRIIYYLVAPSAHFQGANLVSKCIQKP